MVKVLITDDEGKQLGELKFTRLHDVPDHLGLTEYSVEYAVRNLDETKFMRRTTTHRRQEDNVLGLIVAALDELSPTELQFERKADQSDMARRLDRTLPEI
jgi:hypothetical protein